MKRKQQGGSIYMGLLSQAALFRSHMNRALQIDMTELWFASGLRSDNATNGFRTRGPHPEPAKRFIGRA
jgi:hypothetical protein